MKNRGLVVIIVIVILGAAIAGLSPYLIEVNKAGYIQVKQALISGDMSVRSEAGLYPQMFGYITTYQKSDSYFFSKNVLDGGTGPESEPIEVRFNDGGTALVSGSLRFSLSRNVEDVLKLHDTYKTYDNMMSGLVRQIVREALMQTAALIKAEESYSTRRAEFTSLVEGQIVRGLYATESEQKIVTDAAGNEFVSRVVSVKYDDAGNPVVRKISPFQTYNISIESFVIQEIDFDDTIDALIAKKKEAEQQRVVAEADAEKAKQEAITAEEQGKARIAIARADEEVKKVTEVTKAEKELEVAELNRQKAEALAAAELIQKQAEAEAATLLVQAGLTPKERAVIDKEIAIGVAAELAKIRFPEMMIFGGGEGSPMNPFDAVGLESFMRLSQSIADTGEETE